MNPHTPTTDFQIGDRVAVVFTMFPSGPRPPIGSTGTVVWISCKSGNPVVSMDEPFSGATQHLQVPEIRHEKWCCTFEDGLGLELVAKAPEPIITSIEDLV